LPYEVAFLGSNIPVVLSTFDFIADVAFVLDVAVNFFISFEDSRGLENALCGGG
jgi:hypothetical protein